MAKKDTGMMTGEPVTYQIPAPAGGVQMETFIPWTLVKRGVRRQVITPIDAPEQFQREAAVERSARKQAKDSPLIRAMWLAHYWQRLIDDGKYRSLTEIAAIEGIDLGQVRRVGQLLGLHLRSLKLVCLRVAAVRSWSSWFGFVLPVPGPIKNHSSQVDSKVGNLPDSCRSNSPWPLSATDTLETVNFSNCLLQTCLSGAHLKVGKLALISSTGAPAFDPKRL